MEDFAEAPRVQMGIDSSAAMGLLAKEGLGKARHVQTQWLWVQQEVRRKRIELAKIPGKENAADVMTKAMALTDIVRHLRTMGCEFVTQ